MLRVARIVLRISLRDASVACGVHLRTYLRYEGGRCEKSRPLVDFCRKYDVSMQRHMDGDGRWIGAHLSKRAKGKVAILHVAAA